MAEAGDAGKIQLCPCRDVLLFQEGQRERLSGRVGP